MNVKRIRTDRQIQACFPVIRQLRPHLVESEFVIRVRRQEASGFRLAAVFAGRVPCAVAGYRIAECLSRGRNLYVDDLVTDEKHRSRGLGKVLLDWLIGEACRHKCEQLALDSGVQRFAAHRFYLRHGMNITAHHFALDLNRQNRNGKPQNPG